MAAHINIDAPAREPLMLSWEDICCTVPAPASPGAPAASSRQATEFVTSAL